MGRISYLVKTKTIAQSDYLCTAIRLSEHRGERRAYDVSKAGSRDHREI
jgi:hypothetical protein